MIKTLALSLAVVLSAAPALAQPQISEARIRQDMATLSSDAFEGRKPGTAGETKTLAFLERAFAEAGLEPGAPGGGWRQAVALGERSPVRATLVAGGLDLSADLIVLGKRAAETFDAPLAYGGYATRPGEAARDALVLYRNADQPKRPFPQPTDAFTRSAALKGAKGILAIVDDKAFEGLKVSQRDVIGLESDFPFAVRGFIRQSAAQKLLAAGGADLAALDLAAEAPDFQPRAVGGSVKLTAETRVRTYDSHNVIGRLTGRTAPGQALVYTAHWDSFGPSCRAEGADRLCNGAIDNASGTAGMIELARAFTAGPTPDRTILFIATTAEERGLLGARAYAASPSIPLKETVAAFNIDTIALYPRGNPAGFVGAGYSTADAAMAELAAAQGRTLDVGDGTRMVLKSSDAWAMMRAGVPAYILSGMIARSGPDKGAQFLSYVSKDYHSPADEMAKDHELGGAVEEIELLYSAGRRFSAADATVDFLPGAPFRRPTP